MELLTDKLVALLACLPALALAAGVAVDAPVVVALLALLGAAVGARMGARAARLEAEVRARRRVRDELTATELSLASRNRELTEAQDHEVALATLSERARIAREIHDNVGHLLTRGVVQMEALRVVGEGTPVEGGLASVSDTLREALDEVRASVHDLRDDSCDLSVQVRAAAERACADTGVEASCHVEAGEAPREVAACLLAVEREALSNALRHARGLTRVTVELVEHPALWRLTVTDDGAAPSGGEKGEAPGAGRGMGLASMEERVRALGGHVSRGPESARRLAGVRERAARRREGEGRMRVVVIDDDAVVVSSLAIVLGAEADIEVVGTGVDGADAAAPGGGARARRGPSRHPDAGYGRPFGHAADPCRAARAARGLSHHVLRRRVRGACARAGGCRLPRQAGRARGGAGAARGVRGERRPGGRGARGSRGGRRACGRR